VRTAVPDTSKLAQLHAQLDRPASDGIRRLWKFTRSNHRTALIVFSVITEAEFLEFQRRYDEMLAQSA